MPSEVELKFDVEPQDAQRIRDAAPMSGQAGSKKEFRSVYFDTEDHLLRQSGFSLRIRGGGDRCVQTIKQRSGGAVGLFVRGEWEEEVPGFELDRKRLNQSVLKRLVAGFGAGALQPRIETRFMRTRWMVVHRGSRIEVVYDEGVVTLGAVEAPICELELELIEGKPRALFRLAEEIGATAPLRLGVLSKSERGYALATARLGQASKAEMVVLQPTMTEGNAFKAVAYSCLRHFRLNEISLLQGVSSEPLHQARVALRRLRSALALFRPTVAGKEYQYLRSELRWLSGALSDARDLDVLVARDGGSADKVLLACRDEAYRYVEAVLHADRVRALVLRLAIWIEAGPWRFRNRAGKALDALAQVQLERQWREIRRRGERIVALDPVARHRFRLDIKKLRYSAEFLSALYAGKRVLARAQRFQVALKAVQERLGDLNDHRLGRDFLPGASPASVQEETTGLLAAAQAEYDEAAAVAGYWRSK